MKVVREGIEQPGNVIQLHVPINNSRGICRCLMKEVLGNYFGRKPEITSIPLRDKRLTNANILHCK